MDQSLKHKTRTAFYWSFFDKSGKEIIQFIVWYILALNLSPSEIGVFGILAIFSAIANILQESGFSSALIRKANPSESEYSSVFYFNISISFFLYLLLFVSAPLISRFYDEPALVSLARYSFLAFIFNAFGIIQNVILVKRIDFKTSSIISLSASIVSGVLAIWVVKNHFGVWSLVIQQVSLAFIRSALLWVFIKWKPSKIFSFSYLRSTSVYSGKLLINNLINHICSNIYNNVLAKKSLIGAGLYAQANKLALLPQAMLIEGVKNVAFPTLSKLNHDYDQLKHTYRKIINLVACISFPIAFISIVLAEPLVLLFLKEKWAGIIPILQVLTVGTAFYPLQNLISTLLQSIGKSGMLLKIESSRNILAILILIFSAQWGVKGIVYGITIHYILYFVIAMPIASKQISYSKMELVRDTFPYIIYSMMAYIPFSLLPVLGIDNFIYRILITTIGGSMIYLLILRRFRKSIWMELLEAVRHMIYKK